MNNESTAPKMQFTTLKIRVKNQKIDQTVIHRWCIRKEVIQLLKQTNRGTLKFIYISQHNWQKKYSMV